jgi:hypothetical protein
MLYISVTVIGHKWLCYTLAELESQNAYDVGEWLFHAMWNRSIIVVLHYISYTDHVRNNEVLLRVKKQRNILYEMSKQKANLIGHILRRNCLLQRIIGGKIKGGI